MGGEENHPAVPAEHSEFWEAAGIGKGHSKALVPAAQGGGEQVELISRSSRSICRFC